MKKQTAFIFLPLLFGFNGIGFSHTFHMPHFSYGWQAQRTRSAAIREYFPRSERDRGADENATDTPVSDPQMTPQDPPLPDAAGIPVAADSPGDATFPGNIIPILPGVPNTGVVDVPTDTSTIATATAAEVIPAGTSTEGAPVQMPAPAPLPTDGSSTVAEPPPVQSGSIFSTGGVTFRFDDGWQSQVDNALPILKAAGIKGTFYIVTRQLLDDGYSGFVSSSEVQQLAAEGEDIGAHTQTHPHLPTLSVSAQQHEISGSRSDLIALGITPSTLSYPYGEYTATDVQIAQAAGFAGAVTTEETPVSPVSDPYQIQSPSLQVTDTPEKIEAMIDAAVRNHQWLILTFHRVDTSGDQYSITPQNFQRVVQYVAQNQIPTVTVAQGLQSLQR